MLNYEATWSRVKLAMPCNLALNDKNNDDDGGGGYKTFIKLHN